MATREELFPSKYLRPADLKGRPIVVQIQSAPTETLKSTNGEAKEKCVLHFVGAQKSLPLNLTNFCAVAEIAGDDDSANWPGIWIEVYPTKTQMAGDMVDCIRIRAPAQRELMPTQRKPAPKATKPAADEDDLPPWLTEPDENAA